MKTRVSEDSTDNLPAFGPTLKFMRLLWSVDHELQSASKRMKKSLGVTGPQRLVLRVLGRSPGSSPGDVARVLHIDPSTLTGVLKRLEEKNFIQRKIDPTDGRRAFLHLTAKGRAVDAKTNGSAEAAVRRALARAKGRDVESARSLLMILNEELRRSV